MDKLESLAELTTARHASKPIRSICPVCKKPRAKLARHLRKQHGLTHEAAVKLSVTARKAKKHRKNARQQLDPCRGAEPRTYAERDSVLRSMGFKSYPAYLASELWSSIRARVIDRDLKCRICNGKGSSCHHVSYSKDALNGDDIDFIIYTCKSCHKHIEFRGERKRPFIQSRRITIELMAKAEKSGAGKWLKPVKVSKKRGTRKKQARLKRQMDLQRIENERLLAESYR